MTSRYSDSLFDRLYQVLMKTIADYKYVMYATRLKRDTCIFIYQGKFITIVKRNRYMIL